MDAETRTNNDEINTELRLYSGNEIDEPRRQKEEDSIYYTQIDELQIIHDSNVKKTTGEYESNMSKYRIEIPNT